ncbi:hypothetical protein EDD11_006224 [Mortierella claussenii]|nr:hypothetical protein EDD11_006224 [Mortierella claussenii]
MSELHDVKQDAGFMTSLKRTWSPIRALTITVSATSAMSGIVPLTQASLGAGGPVTMVFGFAFASTMAFAIAVSLADIASGFPNIKGGLIEYSRRLAPPSLVRISSWIVGWLHFFALTTSVTSCAFSFALFSTSAIEIATGSVPGRWITVLIHISVSILFGAMNALSLNVDMISVVWHLVGPIVVLMTVAASVKDPPSAAWVFTHFENQTGWSSSFYVTLLGLLQGAFTMTAYDAPIHTMYNTENAALRVPRGIISGFLISFVTGEILIMTLLFGIKNIQNILHPAISGISAVEIFVHLIGSFGVTCILAIFMGTFFFCGQGLLRACSQIGLELALSGAFPKSKYLSKVGSNGQPSRVGWMCTIISCGIGMLYIFNTTILQAMTSAVAMELNLILGYWYFSARHWFGKDRTPACVYEDKKEAHAEARRNLPILFASDGSIQERDLDEIENWLDHLERDLRSLI